MGKSKMANYLEVARQVLAAMAEPDSPGGPEAPSSPRSGGTEATIPPAAEWPQSLSELAAEAGQHSGDPEGARRRVWMDWYEWMLAPV